MSQKTTEKPRKWNHIYSIAIIVFCGIAASVLFVLVSGKVSGEQFNPCTFAQRSFSYRQIPLVNIQITPVKFSPVSDDFEVHLSRGELLPKANKNDEWHPIETRWRSRIETGDAKILTDFLLEENKDQQLIWIDWSEKHPKKAAVLWPLVSSMAKNQAYPMIPELFRFVQQRFKDPQFEEKTKLKISDLYVIMASEYADAKHWDRSLALFDAAVLLRPNSAELYRQRAKVYEAFGKLKEAQEDRKKVKHILASEND